MTRAEWLACDNLLELLSTARQMRAGKRPLLLFGCGCCRLAWDALTDERSRSAIDATELWAGGFISSRRRAVAAKAADAARIEAAAAWERSRQDRSSSERMKAHAVSLAAHVAFHVSKSGYYDGFIGQVRSAMGFWAMSTRPDETRERERFCGILQDVFNPWRQQPAPGEWLTTTAVAIARQIYAARDFSLLPVLADALMDAGCEDADVLAHCNSTEPHVRGCWVVDLVLGRC